MISEMDALAVRVKASNEKERVDMNDAILSVVRSFAILENSMAQVLGELLHDSWIYSANLIYFAPGSTETRFAIVDAVFTNLRVDGPEGRALKDQQTRFKGRLARARKSRNKVIHGQTVLCGRRGDNGMVMRLTALTGDLKRHEPLVAGGQLPGMSSHDVAGIAGTFDRLVLDTHDFQAICRGLRGDDEPTWRGGFARLEDRHPSRGA